MDETRPESNAPDIDSHQKGVPRHVAIIMDGNSRWARRRNLPSAEGHRAGERMVHAVVRRAAQRGVEVLTLFAFSSENWRRPPDEVSQLLGLFLTALSERVSELHENGIRLRFIGDRSAFSAALRDGMEAAEQRTANNEHMTVVVAANYGGRWDIARAAARLARQVRDGTRDPDSIDATALDAEMSLADLPALDLLIRTGGERRLSNFLLWQAAYSEFHFSAELWPDFGGAAFDEALQDYAGRQRRFGRSGEQVRRLKGDSEC